MTRFKTWWAWRSDGPLELEVGEGDRDLAGAVEAILKETSGGNSDRSYDELLSITARMGELLAQVALESNLRSPLACAWGNCLFDVYARSGDVTYLQQSRAVFASLGARSDAPPRERFLIHANSGRTSFGYALRTGDSDASTDAEEDYSKALALAPRATEQRLTLSRYRRDARRLSRRITLAHEVESLQADTLAKPAAGWLSGPASFMLTLWLSVGRIERRIVAHKKLTSWRGLWTRKAYVAALSELGELFRVRYDRYGRLSDLQESVLAGEWAMACDPSSPLYKTRLSVQVRMLGMHMSEEAHIERAVALAEDAISGQVIGTEMWRTCAWNLAIALKRQHSHVSHDLTLLDRAVSLERELVSRETSRDTSGVMRRNLASSLLQRGQVTGDAQDVQVAYELLSEGIDFERLTPYDLPAVTSLLQAEYLISSEEQSAERVSPGY